MEIPRLSRLKAQRYRLEGSICPACGLVSFPPRPVCPRCEARRVGEADSELLIVLPKNLMIETTSPERMIR